ncbi:MAG: glycosyltransferase family A protein [Micropepsaceae bacterium]
MKLGVIIPVFNRAGLVGTAVRSVLREAPRADLDVVVVDDGSTDGSAAAAEAAAAGSGAVRVLRQANGGVNAARTAGLGALLPDTGLVTFLDSDDLWPEGRLAVDMAAFRDDPSVELTYGYLRMVDGVDDASMQPAANCNEMTVRTIHLGAGLYRRATLEAVGGFDFALPMAEDTDFLFRLFERQPRYRLSEEVAMIYRRHDANMTNDVATMNRCFMRALHKAAVRRRANPALRVPDDVFDLQQMRARGGR